MAVNQGLLVEIVGDTGHLRLHAPPNAISDQFEFVTGSFNPSPDERRVITVRFHHSDFPGTYSLTLRFEFTDPLLATVDTVGQPVYLTAEDRITPFSEPKGKTKDPARETEGL